MSALDTIREQVTNNTVVLYMKGTPQFPQCGFSSNAAQILKACGLQNFLAVNVLADMEIFQNLPLTPTGRPSPSSTSRAN